MPKAKIKRVVVQVQFLTVLPLMPELLTSWGSQRWLAPRRHKTLLPEVKIPKLQYAKFGGSRSGKDYQMEIH